MTERPATWNGVIVPYDRSVAELTRRIAGPAPARWAAFVALAHRPGTAALAVLRDCVASSEPNVRRSAVEAIGAHSEGERLADAVVSLLSDEDTHVVRAACEAAQRLRIVAARDDVRRLLLADDALTRARAVAALPEFWREQDFEPVLRLFRSDPSAEVRKATGWALRSVASPATAAALFEVWRDDPLPRHRTWACELAAEFRLTGKLAELRVLTDDLDGHVRTSAECAVRALSDG